MPNGTFNVYQYIAMVFSAFFILLQLIILLDSVYKLNEYLLEREQCAFTLIALTVVMIVGTIVGMGFLYKVRKKEGYGR
jgi:Serine incorporator (Serinc)